MTAQELIAESSIACMVFGTVAEGKRLVSFVYFSTPNEQAHKEIAACVSQGLKHVAVLGWVKDRDRVEIISTAENVDTLLLQKAKHVFFLEVVLQAASSKVAQA